MDFSNLPKYPEHEEPSRSQSERLRDFDQTERWWSLMIVMIPLLIGLIVLAFMAIYWALSSQDHFVSFVM
jgi:ABC-type multidrug transport system permease subunit